MSKRLGLVLMTVGVFSLAAGAFVVTLNACATPLRVDPLQRKCGGPVVDADLEMARKYAPWLYNEVHPSGGRQDIPAPLDFDGNLNGDDNWDSMPFCELVPTLGYAHVQTRSHHFFTYHAFHPRDWEPVEFGVHTTHEGDGENLQVVIDKASGRVVMLFTQAHYRGGVYTSADSGIASGERSIRGPLLLVDDTGLPSESGTHAAVFIEAMGHGMFGVLDAGSSRASVDDQGQAHFERDGFVLRPARLGDDVSEPSLDASQAVPYQLESTTAKVWLGVKNGELVGEGRAFDKTVPYSDARVSIDLPKFHRGNRFSGPLGASRGISPFAVDFGWSQGTLGAIFFDPAKRYAQVLKVPGAWSLEYVDYPFATP